MITMICTFCKSIMAGVKGMDLIETHTVDRKDVESISRIFEHRVCPRCGAEYKIIVKLTKKPTKHYFKNEPSKA